MFNTFAFIYILCLTHFSPVSHFYTPWKLITAWKVSKYRVISGSYFPEFGLNTQRYLSVFSPHARKYGPQKTPYLDTFHALYEVNQLLYRSNQRRCFVKRLFLKIYHYSQKNTCTWGLQPETCKKEILVQVFSCAFCEIFKNSFFTEHIWTTPS